MLPRGPWKTTGALSRFRGLHLIGGSDPPGFCFGLGNIRHCSSIVFQQYPHNESFQIGPDSQRPDQICVLSRKASWEEVEGHTAGVLIMLTLFPCMDARSN